MRKMLWASAGIALTAAAGLVIYGNGHASSATPSQDKGVNSHVLAGRELAVEVDGPVRVTLVSGAEGRVLLDWTARWSGWKHHKESWDGDRLEIAFDCGADCSAEYTISVPEGTHVTAAEGTVACPSTITCSLD